VAYLGPAGDAISAEAVRALVEGGLRAHGFEADGALSAGLLVSRLHFEL
jgi:hypothetical protein